MSLVHPDPCEGVGIPPTPGEGRQGSAALGARWAELFCVRKPVASVHEKPLMPQGSPHRLFRLLASGDSDSTCGQEDSGTPRREAQARVVLVGGRAGMAISRADGSGWRVPVPEGCVRRSRRRSSRGSTHSAFTTPVPTSNPASSLPVCSSFAGDSGRSSRRSLGTTGRLVWTRQRTSCPRMPRCRAESESDPP